MAAEWKTQPLEEVAELTGGFAFKSEDYSSQGRFILRTLNIQADGSIKLDDAVFLPEEKCDLYRRFELYEHDTLFVMVGATLGKVGYIRRDILPALLNQNMWRIRARKGLCDARYLQYAFRFSVTKTLGWASGSARDFVRRDDYRTMGIPVPPLPEQEAIADILGSLDDKIELNRRTNETLEAMARALFKSWFVDFDPVVAKSKGRQPVGMDAETAKLFPSSFVDSEIGRVPKGWKVASLGESTESVKGLSYKGSGLSDSGMPLHNLNSIYEGGGYKHKGLKHYTGEYRNRHICQPGDVIVANTEQGFDYLLIGYPAIVPKRYGEYGLFTHHIFRVRPRNGSPLTNHFVYLLLMEPSFRDRVIGYTNGTTVNALSPDGLNYPVFALPPKDVIQCFEHQVAPLFERQNALHDESSTLGEARDCLLPRLLSGELAVPTSKVA